MEKLAYKRETAFKAAKAIERAVALHEKRYNQLRMLLDTVEIRNATTHVYDKDYAQALYGNIKNVMPAMIEVLEATNISV